MPQPSHLICWWGSDSPSRCEGIRWRSRPQVQQCVSLYPVSACEVSEEGDGQSDLRNSQLAPTQQILECRPVAHGAGCRCGCSSCCLLGNYLGRRPCSRVTQGGGGL